MSIYSEWDIVTVNFNGHSATNNEELDVPFAPTANIFTLALIESTGTIIRIGITPGKKLLLRSISDGSTINSATITGSITYIATT